MVKPLSDTDLLETIIENIKKSFASKELHKKKPMVKKDVATDDDNEDSGRNSRYLDESIDSLNNKYENLDKTSEEMDQSSTKEIFIESHADIQHRESTSTYRNIEKEATQPKLRTQSTQTQSAIVELLKLIYNELKSFKDNKITLPAKDATVKDNLTTTTKETPNDNEMLYRTPKETPEFENMKLRIAELVDIIRKEEQKRKNDINRLLRNTEQMKTKDDIQDSLLTEKMQNRLAYRLSQLVKSSAVLGTTPTAKDSVERIEINI